MKKNSREREEFLALAFYYAMKAHESQFRKSTGRPYIEHPVRAAAILLEMGVSERLVAAGFLHDTLEDTRASLDEIQRFFGPAVAGYVKAVTEDKSLDWETRKARTIKHLAKADRDVLLLSLADKLDNIRSIAQDHSHCGDEIWRRFVRPKEKQEWYYRSLARVFAKRLPKLPQGAEFDSLVKTVFGQPLCSPR
ncbi:MAG: HD domain-containing protein [Elusimicrobiales bacterium]